MIPPCDVDWNDESKESSFMACVTLALADWNNCAYQPWKARPELCLLAQQCESLAQGGPIELVDNVKIGAEQLIMCVREEGLYTTPETPVHQLMRKNDMNVYLL
jgi:hypothetical protein